MASEPRPRAIAKRLTANDTGESGAHQAGIHIPKRGHVLSFFPRLEGAELNPRHHLVFYDQEGARWEFVFIHYNNKLFGGTRNEYRLTCMTSYLKRNALKPGDEVVLSRDLDAARLLISHRRASGYQWTPTGALKLQNMWREIKL